ncbi:fumarate reductase/succinate dehydrogenase flavoprotein subunit [Candidatus Methylacidithermus pantelleriae]|uniref:succinate dehydrogenase n=1 Tax=Candidatus Methylacidithermus pantelleriae TaxID=2744239 RepID=A0A8J2BVN6_9BACT|nr:fumarate reductase/succinate dehydrogenase flavoprotein subunit [Candidatus Methylacidithermus pantelleriae]CAF0702604.1 Succinate dehydrogenase/fumarate reductase, flavoprotein subunit [Candidatus Methylacidithermus pantelleriae]
MNFPLLKSRIPEGDLSQKWTRCKDHLRLISPVNRRKYRILVVGTGLAGSSAAASLAELGYQVRVFTLHDSPRRAHSVAAQGGINAAKNYCNDGDSVWRLFYETLKGGDFRSREANVYRLAELSVRIIDQCVAQGVPFAREYGGLLANRSFGGALVSRTFYARGATGQQLLLGAYQALSRQVALGRAEIFPRSEMLELVVCEGKACGIVTRNLLTGEITAHAGDAVVLATGGYANLYFLSTNGRGANATAIWRAYKQGAGMANPCFVQVHPTCLPPVARYQSKLTLMSESLRNDGRVWVPKKPGDSRRPNQIPEEDRDYFLERLYPSYGNLVPRDIASRAVKQVCDEGRGVGPMGKGVYLDFSEAISRLGRKTLEERYGNLFAMYREITGEDPYETPMRIYPAVHYTMGGLWVDYLLMSTLPGLFAIGECNFSDHGANRLGASALMQALADGYFILPYAVGDYLASHQPGGLREDHAVFTDAVRRCSQRITRLLELKGRRPVVEIHRELGELLWAHCGITRTDNSLRKALSEIGRLKEVFWREAIVPGKGEELNQALEYAGRVADFLELAELLCWDALERRESCGCHFREEFQDSNGQGIRDDVHYAHVAVWFYRGDHEVPLRAIEPLVFESTVPEARSYQ